MSNRDLDFIFIKSICLLGLMGILATACNPSIDSPNETAPGPETLTTNPNLVPSVSSTASEYLPPAAARFEHL